MKTPEKQGKSVQLTQLAQLYRWQDGAGRLNEKTLNEYRRPDVGLLRAVLAAPDDPLPRQVLADWYDEQGEPSVATALRTGRRMPVDDLTVAACRALVAIDGESRWQRQFIDSACRPVVEWADVNNRPGSGFATVRALGVEMQVVVAVADRLTPKQVYWVWRIVWERRRDVRDKSLVERAHLLLTGVCKGIEGLGNVPADED